MTLKVITKLFSKQQQQQQKKTRKMYDRSKASSIFGARNFEGSQESESCFHKRSVSWNEVAHSQATQCTIECS